MRLRRPEPHTLAGAYALDAVAGRDRARFGRHLARCQACARELTELREATARLAVAAAAEPPAGMIERAVAAAGRTRQLAPATGQAAPVERLWRLRLGGRRAAAGGRVWPARPGFSLAVTAALLAAAVALGTVALRAEHHLGTAARSEHLIAEVLNAPDAALLTARVKAGGSAAIVMSRRDRSLVFTAAGLPRLPAARCYQLWLVGPAGDRSAGMLPAPHGGMTGPVVASGLAAGDWVGLTVEPDGGSREPTTRPIVMISLAG